MRKHGGHDNPPLSLGEHVQAAGLLSDMDAHLRAIAEMLSLSRPGQLSQFEKVGEASHAVEALRKAMSEYRYTEGGAPALSAIYYPKGQAKP